MSIIHKYVTREIGRYFAIVLTLVVGIYLIVDFFEKIDNFMEADLPLFKVASYFQLKLPLIVAQVTPVSIMLAILIAFGLMNKNNEIIALKSSGVSVYYLLRPILGIGFISTLLVFCLSEIVVPITLGKANKIWRLEVQKKAAVTSRQKNIWIKGHRSIYYIAYFNPQNTTISGITLNYFDEDFRLIKRVDARGGQFQGEKWVLKDVMIQTLNKDEAGYDVAFYPVQVEPIDFLPEDLKRVVKKSEEMNILEIWTYIQDVESEGYDATVYRVDFHAKFALPFVCLIMSIIAAGISVRRKIRESLSVNIAYGVGMIFLYWVIHSFCLSLGSGGMLPPFVAAWVANVLFFCFGLFTLITAE
ncbi:MAG: LPS export ABC transporter permease LptG [Desulfobacterales bacterium]|nr:MAG: LPS export ABC transporter permease LptG [Desulfobacterales bacterium]